MNEKSWLNVNKTSENRMDMFTHDKKYITKMSSGKIFKAYIKSDKYHGETRMY